jgi:hypothetical protein
MAAPLNMVPPKKPRARASAMFRRRTMNNFCTPCLAPNRGIVLDLYLVHFRNYLLLVVKILS